MASKDLTFKIQADPSAAVRGFEKVAEAAKRSMGDAEAALDELLKKGYLQLKVGADTTEAVRSIDDVLAKVDKLAGTESANLLLSTNASNIVIEIADLIGELQKLDATDPKVDIVATDIRRLESDLGRLESKAKELNGTPISLDTKQATQGIDRISGSARGANSALANMIGNTSQDLGKLGGLAGSAGVALGQMGEYAADAALGGEKLGSALGSMAKVAGPIALVGAAVLGVTNRLKDAAETEAFKTDSVEAFTEALRNGEDAAEGLAEKLREAGKVELNIDLGQGFRLDVTGALADAGLNLERFSQLATEGEGAINEWATAALAAGADADAVGIAVATLTQQNEFYAEGARVAAETSYLFADATKAALDALKTAPLDSMTRSYIAQAEAVLEAEEAVVALRVATDEAIAAQKNEPYDAATRSYIAQARAIEDATEATRRALAAAEDAEAQHRRFFAALEEGTSETERLAEATDGAEASHRRHFAALVDVNDGLRSLATDADVAAAALADMESPLGQMAASEGALQRVFALGNAPVDAASAFRDLENDIHDLSEAADGLDLSEGLDVSNVSLDPLLDAFDGIRPQIQSKIAEAFQGGGPAAATAVAQGYVDNIYNELGGRVSKADIEAALGITGGIDAFVNVIIEQTAIDKARAQLALLTSLTGGTPLTAAVALALDAGTITGEQAQAIILGALGEEGVQLPVGLIPPTAQEIAAAMAALTGDVPDTKVPLSADAEQFYADLRAGVAAAQAERPVVRVGGDTGLLIDAAGAGAQRAAAFKPVMAVDGNTAGLDSDVSSARTRITSRSTSMPVRGNYTGTDNIPSSITVRVRGLLSPIAVAAGGIFTGAARTIQSFAQGGMTRLRDAEAFGPGETMFAFREPETKGESFIPHAPSKRRRSLEILRRTAQIIGAPYSMADGGVTANYSSTVTAPTVNNGGDVGQMVAELNRTLARTPDAIAAATARGMDSALRQLADQLAAGRRF